MSKTKHKKRHSQGRRGYTPIPVEESEFASNGRRKRMNSTARNLLFLSLICLAISEVLVRTKFLSETVALVISIIALVALVLALYLQFGSSNGGSSGSTRL